MKRRVTMLAACLLLIGATLPDAWAQVQDDAESYAEFYQGKNEGTGWATGFLEVANGAADGGTFLETDRPITDAKSFGLITDGSQSLSGAAVSRSFESELSTTREFTFSVRFSSTGNLTHTGVSLNQQTASNQAFWDDGQRLFVGVNNGVWEVNGTPLATNGKAYAAVDNSVYDVSIVFDPNTDGGLFEVTINNRSSVQGQSNTAAGALIGTSGAAIQSVSYSIITDGETDKEKLTWDDMSLSGPHAPLPVELASFEAVQNDEGVVLSWKTASETNNSGFHVERSVDGGSTFEEIDVVNGAGTTAKAQRYRFVDKEMPFEAQTVTYRLKQVDYDGAFEYSDHVEVAAHAPRAFTLRGNHPNPFNPATTIRYELPEAQHVRLAVYDMMGREVAVLVDRQQEAGRKEIRFNAADLSSGTYLYRIQAGRFSKTRQMVLLK